MKIVLRFGLLLILGALVLVGCEEDPDDEFDSRDDYLGTWNVKESAGQNSPQNYTVEIETASTENQILIKGLYNVPGTEVRASIDGLDINIPNQVSAGINFSGSGTANAAVDEISLSFTANDGTGADMVEATLTQ